MATKRRKRKTRKRFITKLRSHYKVVLLNVDTFEERFSLMLTPINVMVVGGLAVIAMFLFTVALLGWTPLRYYLPEYADEVRTKKLALDAAIKADSMEIALAQRDQYIANIRNVVEGRLGQVQRDTNPETTVEAQKAEYTRSREDSLLRVEIEKEDLVNLNPNFNRDAKSSYLLFPPMKGSLTDRFNAQREHYGVDIAGPKDATVKAIDDGTVIIATYTAETGYIIQVQHDNDLVSVYKHNATLLKKQGEKVRAGEAIAIIGTTGEYSTGPHLHFEMWRNGVALNPETFFSFE